jgi:hypothetical protein
LPATAKTLSNAELDPPRGLLRSWGVVSLIPPAAQNPRRRQAITEISIFDSLFADPAIATKARGCNSCFGSLSRSPHLPQRRRWTHRRWLVLAPIFLLRWRYIWSCRMIGLSHLYSVRLAKTQVDRGETVVCCTPYTSDGLCFFSDASSISPPQVQRG